MYQPAKCSYSYFSNALEFYLRVLFLCGYPWKFFLIFLKNILLFVTQYVVVVQLNYMEWVPFFKANKQTNKTINKILNQFLRKVKEWWLVNISKTAWNCLVKSFHPVSNVFIKTFWHLQVWNRRLSFWPCSQFNEQFWSVKNQTA